METKCEGGKHTDCGVITITTEQTEGEENVMFLWLIRAYKPKEKENIFVIYYSVV